MQQIITQEERELHHRLCDPAHLDRQYLSNQQQSLRLLVPRRRNIYNLQTFEKEMLGSLYIHHDHWCRPDYNEHLETPGAFPLPPWSGLGRDFWPNQR